MAVNKVFDGCVETAQAVFNITEITVIAESRTYSFEKYEQDVHDLPVAAVSE